jgi:NAD(P)-dependent dehydrogenase (short-subunit alcohol dehydrogenase family)
LRQSSAPGAALYVASKHAVEGFTKAAALEFAETGVRINVVAPGTIETGMLNRFAGTPENKADLISRVPMKRIAQPEEIAESYPFPRLRCHLPPMAGNAPARWILLAFLRYQDADHTVRLSVCFRCGIRAF